MMTAHNASCNGFFMATLASDKVESLLTKTVKRRTGRPPGSKTRPDAPSKVAKLQRDASGHFLSSKPAAPPDARLTAPAPVAPAPLPAAPGEAKPDTDLFGATPKFEGEAPPDDAPPMPNEEGRMKNEKTAEGGTPPPDDGPKAETAESQRPLAEFLFVSAIQLLAMLIGPFWFPRKKGDSAETGEIPFDEKEMVVEKLCAYFHSVGMAVLTPLQDLWMAIGLYAMPRLGLTFAVLKQKFGKKKSANPPNAPGDTRFAKPPPETEKTAETETVISI